MQMSMAFPSNIYVIQKRKELTKVCLIVNVKKVFVYSLLAPSIIFSSTFLFFPESWLSALIFGGIVELFVLVILMFQVNNEASKYFKNLINELKKE